MTDVMFFRDMNQEKKNGAGFVKPAPFPLENGTFVTVLALRTALLREVTPHVAVWKISSGGGRRAARGPSVRPRRHRYLAFERQMDHPADMEDEHGEGWVRGDGASSPGRASDDDLRILCGRVEPRQRGADFRKRRLRGLVTEGPKMVAIPKLLFFCGGHGKLLGDRDSLRQGQ